MTEAERQVSKKIAELKAHAETMQTAELSMTIGAILEVFVDRYGISKTASMFQSMTDEIKSRIPPTTPGAVN